MIEGEDLMIVMRAAEILGIPERCGVNTCEATRILLEFRIVGEEGTEEDA